MFVKIVRQAPGETLVSESRQLLFMQGEAAGLFQIDAVGDTAEISRVVGERRLRAPPRCGPWRRELMSGLSRP
jgi:hypothetical protein